jgi:hypothetical protein
MKFISTMLLMAMFVPSVAFAQTSPQNEIWRAFAQKVDVGTRLKVRLDDGQRVVATLIEADADGLLVQPRTRVPVPVQRIAYDRIASLERDDARGIGVGKAVAIGVGSGVGAFLGIFLILLATLD